MSAAIHLYAASYDKQTAANRDLSDIALVVVVVDVIASRTLLKYPVVL